MEYSTYIHEIKNPLNAIYGLIQLIENSNELTEIKQYNELIKHSCDRIQQINTDFSTYQNTTVIECKKETVNVGQLLNKIIDEHQGLARQYNIRIVRNIKTARAFTDSGKLAQAIINLISNAIKYGISNTYQTNNSSVPDSNLIEVECLSTGVGAKIVIRDHGIGMSCEELKKIESGTLFYRAKRIERPGTGLGLNIVKAFAKKLNWDLTIKSELGHGTTVTLTIHHIMG